MRVDLRIDELVLHGVAPRDRHRVADAIERELGRLLAADGAAAATGLARTGARSADHAAPPPIALAAGAGAEAIGRGVAGAIFRALSPTTATVDLVAPERGS